MKTSMRRAVAVRAVTGRAALRDWARRAGGPCLEEPFEECEDFLPSFCGFLVSDIVPEQLPPFGMPGRRIHVLQRTFDDVEPRDRRQLILQPGQSEVGPRR